jgi:transposase InsO family protein
LNSQEVASKKYSVRQLCRLFKVNRAWYYERQTLRAEREKAETELKTAVEALLLEFNGYGYRRVTKALQRQGWRINHKKVLRLLRKWGLLCRPLRKKKIATTQSDPKAPYAENLLKKHEAELAEVNRAWVGDVVMVVTKKERGYLASLLDRYSRRCVGWAISPINDTALTLAALNRAIANRQPQAGLIHHSDHGSNYTSGEYQARLSEIGARISHSRKGRPQENGIAESFNKTVSYEKLFLEEYENLAQVETSLSEWLEDNYNARRLHSSLGYLPPVEFEASLKSASLLLAGQVGGLA